ncbi:MAG: hypothetical protein ACLFP4_17455 [Spirochaetales bacterium]
MGQLRGIWGHPFINLEPYLDLSVLPEIHEEICMGLTQVPVAYTGGSHRSMGIMPPSRVGEAGVDYGEVLAGFDDQERKRFIELAEDPAEVVGRDVLQFGEEKEHGLSIRQMLYLKVRYGVYFPWKAFYEMIPNKYWDEKSSAVGKSFTRQAKAIFPKTVKLVQSLPFVQVGRCNIMGLEAFDHGTVHKDGEHRDKPAVDHFITLCPVLNKRLFLWDDGARTETYVSSHAYWFNDSDYHGVAADPFFRYSIRVDGVFEPEFFDEIRKQFDPEVRA